MEFRDEIIAKKQFCNHIYKSNQYSMACTVNTTITEK